MSLAEISSGIEVRLVEGKHNYEGRIEAYYNGTWRAICDHGWNRNAARVVCRMLGFPDVLRFTKGCVFHNLFVNVCQLIMNVIKILMVKTTNFKIVLLWFIFANNNAAQAV